MTRSSIGGVGAGVFVAALLAGAWTGAGAARGQTPGGDGLAAFIPKEALLYIERRGHTAVQAAMADSNFGRLAADESIRQFADETRSNAERLIVRSLFALKKPADVEAKGKLLHEALKPFWYQPSALCVVPGEGDDHEPGLALMCATGAYKADCLKAIDALIKVGVSAEGAAATRHAFTYRKHEAVWKVVLQRSKPFELPKEPKEQLEALKDGHVLMVCWIDEMLLIASKPAAADAMSRMFSIAQPGTPLAGEKDFQAVAARTVIKDWAFRWHANTARALEIVRKGEEGELPWPMVALGLEHVRAVGGTEGFADKVVTRRTFVYAPPTGKPAPALLRPGADYRRGLAMTPPAATASVAGQVDAATACDLLETFLKDEHRGRRGPESRPEEFAESQPAESAESGPADRAQSRPARPVKAQDADEDNEDEPDPRATTGPDGRRADRMPQALAQMRRLGLACDGSASLYVMDFQGFLGLIGGGGAPIGLVLGVKDRPTAEDAVKRLVELAKPPAKPKEDDDEDEDDEPRGWFRSRGRHAPLPATYRNVPIHYVADVARVAVLKDRVVVAMSRAALTAGVDAALDGTGGFAADGKARALAALDGGGALIYQIDTPRLARLFWPLMTVLTELEYTRDYVPLASMPATDKLVGLLGPEVGLVEVQPDGLLLKGRGTLPLATKNWLLLPLAKWILD